MTKQFFRRVGITLMVVGGAAGMLGASLFTSATEPSPFMDWLGYICFLFWWLPFGVGWGISRVTR